MSDSDSTTPSTSGEGGFSVKSVPQLPELVIEVQISMEIMGVSGGGG